MVNRQVRRWDVTPEEIENLKRGLCWCGKPREQFDKGMRVYCCKAHSAEWWERTMYWSTFKDNFLSEHGEKCDKCGIDQDGVEKLIKQKVEDWKKQILSNPEWREKLEQERTRQLLEVERMYSNTMDNNWLLEHCFGFVRDDSGIPPMPRDYDLRQKLQFEVDHKKAIVNGGKTWDKKNLQVLCNTCHKEKTKEDMRTKRNGS